MEHIKCRGTHRDTIGSREVTCRAAGPPRRPARVPRGTKRVSDVIWQAVRPGEDDAASAVASLAPLHRTGTGTPAPPSVTRSDSNNQSTMVRWVFGAVTPRLEPPILPDPVRASSLFPLTPGAGFFESSDFVGRFARSSETWRFYLQGGLFWFPKLPPLSLLPSWAVACFLNCSCAIDSHD